MSNDNTRTVYVSLVREFLCCYLKMEVGGERFPTEEDLRRYMNQNYRRWWCSVYDSFDHASKYDPQTPRAISEEQFNIEIDRMGLRYETAEANRKFAEQHGV